LMVGAAFAIVGVGLISTWSVDVSAGRWIGFQVSHDEKFPRTNL
jgi:hypothetical protein